MTGFISGATGIIANQTSLLYRIEAGLQEYNSMPLPLVDQLSMDIFKDNERIPQAPLRFRREAEGVNPDFEKLSRRTLSFPLEAFETEIAWTRTGIEDQINEETLQEVEGAFRGDEQRVIGLAMAAIFTKRTVGSIATAYQAGFYNGETDVPQFGQNTFGSAHYHYKGTGSTTLTRAMITDCVLDVREHGYVGPYLGLFSIAQADDVLALQDPGSGVVAGTPARIAAIDQGTLRGTLVAGVYCVFSEFVPDGYFAVIDPGARPLGRRLHPDPSVRGLKMIRDIETAESPLLHRYFRRRIGFRVRQLGAGAARYLTAAGTAATDYTNPTMAFA